ncbi:hypothetical protein GCM10023175_24280 [Pseudonocardia xishanensis]|uniref:Uncharacterized protein n=1 Tax=Pseudonocardia xishanensis TaxID=630995 RepID=A0ABP8RRZ9_9PSEU
MVGAGHDDVELHRSAPFVRPQPALGTGVVGPGSTLGPGSGSTRATSLRVLSRTTMRHSPARRPARYHHADRVRIKRSFTVGGRISGDRDGGPTAPEPVLGSTDGTRRRRMPRSGRLLDGRAETLL